MIWPSMLILSRWSFGHCLSLSFDSWVCKGRAAWPWVQSALLPAVAPWRPHPWIPQCCRPPCFHRLTDRLRNYLCRNCITVECACGYPCRSLLNINLANNYGSIFDRRHSNTVHPRNKTITTKNLTMKKCHSRHDHCMEVVAAIWGNFYFMVQLVYAANNSFRCRKLLRTRRYRGIFLGPPGELLVVFQAHSNPHSAPATATITIIATFYL